MRVDYKIVFPASKNKIKKERKIGHVEIWRGAKKSPGEHELRYGPVFKWPPSEEYEEKADPNEASLQVEMYNRCFERGEALPAGCAHKRAMRQWGASVQRPLYENKILETLLIRLLNN